MTPLDVLRRRAARAQDALRAAQEHHFTPCFPAPFEHDLGTPILWEGWGGGLSASCSACGCRVLRITERDNPIDHYYRFTAAGSTEPSEVPPPCIVDAPVHRLRLLGFGARVWENRLVARVALLRLYQPGATLIHGAARGADTILAEEAKAIGYAIEPYPADWTEYRASNGARGADAGPKRNEQMLREGKPTMGLCLGPIWKNEGGALTGTGDMFKRLNGAGVRVSCIPGPLRHSPAGAK